MNSATRLERLKSERAIMILTGCTYGIKEIDKKIKAYRIEMAEARLEGLALRKPHHADTKRIVEYNKQLATAQQQLRDLL